MLISKVTIRALLIRFSDWISLSSFNIAKIIDKGINLFDKELSLLIEKVLKLLFSKLDSKIFFLLLNKVLGIDMS